MARQKKPSGRSTRHPTRKNRKRLEKTKRRCNARSGCTGKRRLTYEMALEAGVSLLRKKLAVERVGVYLCKFCNQYHMTTNPKGTVVAMITRDEMEKAGEG